VSTIGAALLLFAAFPARSGAADPPTGEAAKPAASPTAAPTEAPDALPPLDEATRLFDMAEAANDEGRFAEAEQMLLRAWEKKKTYDVAFALGTAQRNLGRHRDAAEHLAFALKNLPPSELGATQRAIEKELAIAVKEVGTLRVSVNVPGAEVKIGDRSMGTSPLPDPVYVDPGVVTVTAWMEGYQAATQTLEVSKGASVDAQLTLSRPSRVPAYVVGGAGVLSLVVGGVLVGLSTAKSGEARSLRDGILAAGGYCIGASRHPDCGKLEGAVDSSDTMGNASIVAFGVGAAAVAGAALYLLWPARKPPASSHVSVHPAASPDAAGMVISGSF
jgi:hypothetical protein